MFFSMIFFLSSLLLWRMCNAYTYIFLKSNAAARVLNSSGATKSHDYSYLMNECIRRTQVRL